MTLACRRRASDDVLADDVACRRRAFRNVSRPTSGRSWRRRPGFRRPSSPTMRRCPTSARFAGSDRGSDVAPRADPRGSRAFAGRRRRSDVLPWLETVGELIRLRGHVRPTPKRPHPEGLNTGPVACRRVGGRERPHRESRSCDRHGVGALHRSGRFDGDLEPRRRRSSEGRRKPLGRVRHAIRHAGARRSRHRRRPHGCLPERARPQWSVPSRCSGRSPGWRREELFTPEVRVGLSAGEATVDDDDWYGQPVVEAARLCSTAERGQILLNRTSSPR